MTTKKNQSEPFFFFFHIIILILVVGGFGINGLVNFNKLPPGSPIVFIHGIIMLCWYVLAVVQAGLIRSGNQALHRTLGKGSIILALGIVIAGILMTLSSFKRAGSIEIFTVNIFITINFIVLYSLAIYRRKSPNKHKRLILFASLSMLLPALGRITQAAGINDFASLPIWLILILAPLIYDIKSLKKVQKVTILGVVLIILGVVFTISLIGSESWAAMLRSTFG